MNLRKIVCSILFLSFSTSVFADQIKRLPSGKPDFSGVYDTGTMTLEERPGVPGELESVYPWVADLLTWAIESFQASNNADSDPNREAPPKGGVGGWENSFGGGNTGGYNSFYADMFSYHSVIDGKIRTSIIYEPEDGRRPPLFPVPCARWVTFMQVLFTRIQERPLGLRKRAGPFDGPETLAPSERCLISFASTVPTLPSLYNNYKRIVQTDDHIMILQEMVHDARVIRIDSSHSDSANKKWLGDSIAYWEGDRLIVETKNFKKY